VGGYVWYRIERQYYLSRDVYKIMADVSKQLVNTLYKDVCKDPLSEFCLDWVIHGAVNKGACEPLHEHLRNAKVALDKSPPNAIALARAWREAEDLVVKRCPFDGGADERIPRLDDLNAPGTLNDEDEPPPARKRRHRASHRDGGARPR